MSWIQTFTGRRFSYENPCVGDVHLLDIAHALSNQCRYAGHGRFYSVAEHSTILSKQFDDPMTRLIALLHDATEAYCCDLPRPLKQLLPAYQDQEARVWRVIAARFGLPPEIPAEVHEMDTRMLITERPVVFRTVLPWPAFEGVLPIEGVKIECLPPLHAEAHFIAEYLRIRSALRAQQAAAA